MHVTMKIYDHKIVAPRIGDIWIHASQFLINLFIRFFSLLSIKLFLVDVKDIEKHTPLSSFHKYIFNVNKKFLESFMTFEKH